MQRVESTHRSTDGVADGDRRRYRQAREVFEYAYTMLEPFLQPDAGWPGRSFFHLGFGVMSVNFPHLPDEEIHALLGAIQRVFTERTPLQGPAAA